MSIYGAEGDEGTTASGGGGGAGGAGESLLTGGGKPQALRERAAQTLARELPTWSSRAVAAIALLMVGHHGWVLLKGCTHVCPGENDAGTANVNANAAQMAGCDAAVNDGALAVAQNRLKCELESVVPSDCEACFAPDNMQANCHPNTCIDGGHWVELANGDPGGGMEDARDICRCQSECIAHPLATAFQFMSDGFGPDGQWGPGNGWCACLQLANGGSSFEQNVASGMHLHQTLHGCALCDIAHIQGWQDVQRCQIGGQTPTCQANTCHNDGEWVEVALPQATGLCDCARQCVEHPSAIAFQYNADGFCGCLTITGTNFATQLANHQIHQTHTHCTLCTIEHMADAVGQRACYGDARLNDGRGSGR